MNTLSNEVQIPLASNESSQIFGSLTSENMKVTNKINIDWNSSNVNNYDGIKPPNPSLITTKFPNKKGYPIISIKSKREPYGVQYMYYKYGGLGSILGTDMGK